MMADEIRALLVDRSVVARCVYFQILTTLNFDTVSVRDEDEAFQLLQNDNQFDFMILDAGRSDMNGENVVMGIKELTPHVKVIVNTFDIDYADGLLAAGADAFIIKPANPKDIIGALIELDIIG